MPRAGLIVLLLLVRAIPSVAQDHDRAPLVLRLPGGTRALGLGNGFTAGRGAEVLFYNPAQIGLRRGTTLSIQRFGSASTLGSLSITGPMGKISVGAGVQYLEYASRSPVSLYTPPGVLASRGVIGATSFAATVAAAFRWKGVRFGMGAKYAAEHVGGARDGGMAVDLGAARDFGAITVGVALQNLGGDVNIHGLRAELPRRVSLGAATPDVRIGTYFDLAASAAVAVERDGTIVPGGGVELTFELVAGWTVTGRIGATRIEDAPGKAFASPTFGATFGLDRLALDYAFAPYSRGPGAVHRLGIRIQ
jgi:hypothetical protein